MQSNRARIAVLVVAAVVAVGLFVILNGDDEDESPATTTAASSEEAANPGQDGQQANGSAGRDKPKPESEPEIPTITIKGGEPEGGVASLSAESGGEVRFRVVSDTEGEVHVHGYEIYKDVVPGQRAGINFPADIEGAFEIELHSHEVGEFQIAELEVTPN
jgi:hypothetical protein